MSFAFKYQIIANNNLLKHMKNLLINLTIASALITAISPLAFAQNPSDFKFNNHVLAVETDNIAFKTFTAPGWFSFQHPVNWTVTSDDYYNQPNSGFALTPKYMVFIQNTTSFSGLPPVNYTQTQIDVYAGSYEEILAQNLLSSAKDRKGRTQVGGREAFRIWVNSASAITIITVIHYTDNETVRIVSSYQSSNSSALPLIEKIHGSFRSLKQSSNSSSTKPSKKIEPKLPSGLYYAMGTMFNNSWREILNRNARTCIKVVDGPPNNVR